MTLVVSSAVAQPCGPHWLPGKGSAGLNGMVYATIMWDPDGPGPEPARLVVAGDLTLADATSASHIAMWDGSS